MHYLILIHSEERDPSTVEPEELRRVMGEYRAYSDALRAEGVARGGNALEPSSTARTIRVRDGERIVTDGPFAESREQLGGYYLVECASEEQAIDVAARCPGSRYGTVELRPVWDIPG
jgi:hypothetical protein